jgi:hypothetical protein
MALGSTQPLKEMSTRNLPGGKGLPARKADNLIAICELIVYKMWEPRRLTILWASRACYRDTFTLDHSGRAVWGMSRLHPLDHWDRGFKSHSRHGCLFAFILCLCCSVCRYRAYDGLIPFPRISNGDVCIKKLKNWSRSITAVEP